MPLCLCTAIYNKWLTDSPLPLPPLFVCAGARAQVWDSTVLNGDDMSLFFSLGDTTSPKGATKSPMQRLAPEQIFKVNDHEDCSGPNCHF